MLYTRTEVTEEPEVEWSPSLPLPGHKVDGNWALRSCCFGGAETSCISGRVHAGLADRSLGVGIAKLFTRIVSPFCRWGN